MIPIYYIVNGKLNKGILKPDTMTTAKKATWCVPKLSKTQEQILVLMWEGDLIWDEQDRTAGLEDADHNTYAFRIDTFNILLRKRFITFASRPTLYQMRYVLTYKAKKYLMFYCAEEIKDFISDSNVDYE